MSQLRLETTDNQMAYLPGDAIGGIAVWQLDEEVEAIEVRLFWYTQGKGTQDIGIVDTIRFDHPELEGGQPFSFSAPNGPYSFSGTLISLMWGVELVVLPSGDAERIDITISPTGHEVLLTGN